MCIINPTQIFIDRDPDVFVPILHYLRTKTVNCRDIDLKTLKHEAEFYGVLPLGMPSIWPVHVHESVIVQMGSEMGRCFANVGVGYLSVETGCPYMTLGCLSFLCVCVLLVCLRLMHAEVYISMDVCVCVQ